MNKKNVVKHLKGDMKMFKKEAGEDKELIKKLKKKKAKPKKKASKSPRAAAKIEKVIKKKR